MARRGRHCDLIAMSNVRWWPWHRLAEPYPRPAISGEPACNCTPPELIEVADADAYMATTLKAATWAALSSTQKGQALKSAQDALRTLRWCTDEETCCGRDLEDSYTAAASELALVLFNDNTAVFGAADQLPKPVVSREKLGDLEQWFFSPAQIRSPSVLPNDGRVGRHSPTVLRLYPWLLDLIGCWVSRKNETVIPLFRG
jgi:hypothetical protein